MRAWLPETRVAGPEPATERDIEGLNRVKKMAEDHLHPHGLDAA